MSLMEINGSFVMTVPKEWINLMKLKKQDIIKVHLDEDHSNRLILSLPDYE